MEYRLFMGAQKIYFGLPTSFQAFLQRLDAFTGYLEEFFEQNTEKNCRRAGNTLTA